jgi:membrane fusion protein (multidrug efflux system)
MTWRKVVAAGTTAAGALLATFAGCAPGNTYVAPPPPEVTVSPPVRRTLTTYKEYTGTTRAKEQVDLRARVKGFLKEIRFQEGSDVKAGQVLLVIDEEPFQVQVNSAQAQLDQALASLAKAEKSRSREVAKAQVDVDQAALALAQVEERRNRNLLARNAGSREDVDKAEASRKRSEAQVEADQANRQQALSDFDTNILSAKAAVEDARAALENAKINLGYCRIASPIDGRITRRLVDAGNLVGDGTATLLATVVKDDPVYAYSNISDADVLLYRSLNRQGKRVDFRKETVPIELEMSDETGYPHKGRLDYADPTADAATGTVQARGLFENADHAILPGLFVRVRVPLQSGVDSLLLPERAIGTDQAGRFVMTVGPGDVVEQRTVKVGPTSGDGLRVVLEGLKPEDRVVINGLQKARPGAKVNPKEGTVAALTPTRTSEATKPGDATPEKAAVTPKAEAPASK